MPFAKQKAGQSGCWCVEVNEPTFTQVCRIAREKVANQEQLFLALLEVVISRNDFFRVRCAQLPLEFDENNGVLRDTSQEDVDVWELAPIYLRELNARCDDAVSAR